MWTVFENLMWMRGYHNQYTRSENLYNVCPDLEIKRIGNRTMLSVSNAEEKKKDVGNFIINLSLHVHFIPFSLPRFSNPNAILKLEMDSQE